jgi:hypothetical protein
MMERSPPVEHPAIQRGPKPARIKLYITERYVYLPQCCAVLVLLRLLVGARPSAPEEASNKDRTGFYKNKNGKNKCNLSKPPYINPL